MRALYISPHLSATEFGGSLFAATNLQLLRETFGGSVTAASVSRTPHAAAIAIPSTKNRLGTAVANLQGLCGTLTREGVAHLQRLLISERPSLIWLDTSILGTLIPLIRSIVPNAKIVCAFQNVETDLIKQRLKQRQLQYLPALHATWLNERRSARDADLTLALHATDAARILTLYGRPIDALLPIIVPDQMSVDADQPQPANAAQPYVLFVGSGSPPNVEALAFMSRHVAPALRGFRLLAVGSGLGRFGSSFEHPQLEVRGFVEDLSSVYKGAAAVIAPIFSGGGMKVKIAEALMHGKLVIASPFAAIGYESCMEDAICVARTPIEFSSKINSLIDFGFCKSSRSYFENLYSYHAGLKHVEKIITSLRRRAVE